MKKYLVSAVSLLVFLSIIGLFLLGFNNADKGLAQGDIHRIKEAVKSAALQCYSIEGKFPQDIAYLKENYGLIIQEEKYFIQYHYVASNLLPQTDVFVKGE